MAEPHQMNSSDAASTRPAALLRESSSESSATNADVAEEIEEPFDDEDEELDDDPDLQDDSASVVGFSIGPLQRQLSSNSATTNQKVKALSTPGSRNAAYHDEARPIFRGQNESLRERRSEVPSFEKPLPARPPAASSTLPSPWVSSAKDRWHTKDAFADPSFFKGRQRAQTSQSSDSSGSLKKIVKFLQTDHLPKFSWPGESNRPSSKQAHTPPHQHEHQHGAQPRGSWPIEPEAPVHSSHPASSTTASIKGEKSGSSETSPPRKLAPQRPQHLRRTTSDGSLLLHRPPSVASSLGDDSRWVDVHEQVNVRFKAIRDSFADSTAIKMPKFPEFPSLSIPNLQSLRSKASLDMRSSNPSLSSKSKSAATIESPGGHTMSPPQNLTKSNAAAHPHFSKALKNQRGDLVIMGGYRGSILRDARPPHRQLWVPVKVGLNIRKVNLEVGLEHGDEEQMPETIIPGSMLANIGPVDISKRLFKKLRGSTHAKSGALRIHDYGYDWRLSPHLLSRQLIQFLETLPCNRPGVPAEERGATVLAHSLGGLITRHACNQRPDLFAGITFVGSPQNCVNILGPLRNGDDVLLSSRVLTAQVNFTFRTSFALLPLDGVCFSDSETGEEYNVDFFDPMSWEKYRLSPCIARPLPPRQQEQQLGPFDHLRGSISSVLPAITGRRNSSPRRASTMPMLERSRSGSGSRSGKGEKLDDIATQPTSRKGAVAPQMDTSTNPQEVGEDPETNVKTAVSIPKDKAWEYLCRTLKEVKQFKEELAYRSELQSKYPPMAVIYGKSIPTVSRAQVKGWEGIKCADAYDDLAFASGDGVVLARAAQLPEGYRPCSGGVVSSDRGHISLLTDLEAVGKCLNVMRSERRRRAKATKQQASSAQAA